MCLAHEYSNYSIYLNHSYLSFLLGDGCQIGHSDPVFNENYAVLDTSLRLSQWVMDED
jgi:hypothetical protein